LGSHPVAVVRYTYTHKQYRERHKTNNTTQKLGRVRTVPRLCGFYPGICLTTEEKARENLSQGSRTNIMLNYRLNGRKRIGKPLKRQLDEAETGLSRPNW